MGDFPRPRGPEVGDWGFREKWKHCVARLQRTGQLRITQTPASRLDSDLHFLSRAGKLSSQTSKGQATYKRGHSDLKEDLPSSGDGVG